MKGGWEDKEREGSEERWKEEGKEIRMRWIFDRENEMEGVW